MMNYNFACVIREDPASAALLALERRNSSRKSSLLNRVLLQIPYLDVEFNPYGINIKLLAVFCLSNPQEKVVVPVK